jgi:hypothetical protein
VSQKYLVAESGLITENHCLIIMLISGPNCPFRPITIFFYGRNGRIWTVPEKINFSQRDSNRGIRHILQYTRFINVERSGSPS